ncbi:MAG: hypothetical protein GY874_12990 [Desulfobacteraceae bacterium]|nr:hypothetical protein [Desulfobacteraceae bacterium]
MRQTIANIGNASAVLLITMGILLFSNSIVHSKENSEGELDPWCNVTISELTILSDGLLTIRATKIGGQEVLPVPEGSWFNVCSLEKTDRSEDIVCKAWMTQLQTALVTGREVAFKFDRDVKCACLDDGEQPGIVYIKLYKHSN